MFRLRDPMKAILQLPLFLFILVIYNLALITSRDGFETDEPAQPAASQSTPTPAPVEQPSPPATPATPTAAIEIPAAAAPANAAVPAPAAAPVAPPQALPAAKTAAASLENHPLDKELFPIRLLSGARMPVTTNGLLLSLAVILLYFELLKSTRTGSATIAEHVFSLLVFMVFFVEWIAFRPAGNITFFIMTLLSFLDVVAGFTITIAAGSRGAPPRP